MAILDKLLRTGEGQKLKALEGLVPHIGALEPEVQALSDEELQARTPALRERSGFWSRPRAIPFTAREWGPRWKRG